MKNKTIVQLLYISKSPSVLMTKYTYGYVHNGITYHKTAFHAI